MSRLVGILLLAVLTFCTPAVAQQAPCTLENPHKHLKTVYGESVRGIGVSERGHLLTLYANENGSFTIIAFINDRELFCIVDTGDGWTFFPKPKKKSGDLDQ